MLAEMLSKRSEVSVGNAAISRIVRDVDRVPGGSTLSVVGQLPRGVAWCMIDSGETRAKLNGAMRDALRKEKVPFVEVATEVVPGDVIVLTVVTGVESQERADRIFGEVAKRFKGTAIRREFKTPEELAREKAATLRIVLQALTGTEPFSVASIAEQAREPSWVIETCLRALAAKGVVQTVGEYDDNPTWTIATKNATYEAAVAAAKDTGFDVG